MSELLRRCGCFTQRNPRAAPFGLVHRDDPSTLLLFNKSIHTRQEGGEGLTTHYSLADTIYAKADVECNGTVCLWLGVRADNPQQVAYFFLF